MMAKRSKKPFVAALLTLTCYGCIVFGRFLCLPYLMKYQDAALESVLVRSRDFGAAKMVVAAQLFAVVMSASIETRRSTR